MEKLQRKTVDEMGPLSKLWNILEGGTGAEENAVQISINDLLHYVEQTVLLLGQSSNAITYHRRLNLLESRKVYPLIKRLFLSKSIPEVPLAGRLKHFIGAWVRITQNPKILDIVKGYKIPFHSTPFQSKIPSQPNVSRGGEELVKPEVKEMLKKAAIRKVQPSQGEFVSNLFLLKKKDVGQRPVINLKQLNAYIPHCDFKMEGLQNLNYVLQKRDYMC